jgi:hypothetical protein
MNKEVLLHVKRLGLPNCDITIQDVKKAYHILALKWHPDKCTDPNAGARFREICESYQWLRNHEYLLLTKKSSHSFQGDNFVPCDILNHQLCIRLLIHYIKKGLISIQSTLQTTKWKELADLFGIDLCMVQQYGIFVQQQMNIPITFTVYVTPSERIKTYVHRCIWLHSMTCIQSIPIHIVVNLKNDDVVLIPPKDIPKDTNRLLDTVDIRIIDRCD